MPKIKIEYFAELREKTNKAEDSFDIDHCDAKQLYNSLKETYDFHSSWEKLGIAINHEMADWNQILKDDDVIVFIPKVAGG